MTVSPKPVLDSAVHSRLLADMESILNVAGVQEKYVRESMTVYCNVAEYMWVKDFKRLRQAGIPGLVLEGISNPDTRIQAIAGALLRNFIDARVVPIGTLLDLNEDGDLPTPTVLLIPNFYVSIQDKTLVGWKVQIAYDILLQRASQNKPTVLYVQNKHMMEKNFGSVLSDFLKGFKWVTE